MAHLKKWAAVAAAVASVSLAGVIGMAPVLAGAAPSNDAIRHSIPTASPVVKFKPGTYEWYNNGAAFGTITVAKHNTFTSSIGTPTDSGTWVQSGDLAGLYISGGVDVPGDCVFAGKVNAAGTAISSASKPGNWVCPGDSSGTFYIAPVPAGPSATQAHGGSFTRSGALPIMAGPIVLGTYNWVVDGDYSGNITFAAGDTYTSTLSSDDSGSWVQGGKSVALTVNGGSDGDGGCLFVGKSNGAGTAIGNVSTPGNWVCPGYATKGTFVIS